MGSQNRVRNGYTEGSHRVKPVYNEILVLFGIFKWPSVLFHDNNYNVYDEN